MGKRIVLSKSDVIVTLACVFVLMMTLGAVGKKGRSHAKFIMCQSNLQKWGQIFHLFAQDNNDKLPQGVEGGDVTWEEAYWLGATLPYYDSEIIRFCPMAKPGYSLGGGTFEAWGPFPEDPFGGYGGFTSGSYGFNAWCASPPEDSWYWGHPVENTWRYITVEGAENIPLLLDCIFVDSLVHEYDPPPDDMEHEMDLYNVTWDINAMKLFCIDRHDGGINGVFLDMSVRKVGLKELWTLKWHKDYDTEGPWTQENAPWPEWMADF